VRSVHLRLSHILVLILHILHLYQVHNRQNPEAARASRFRRYGEAVYGTLVARVELHHIRLSRTISRTISASSYERTCMHFTLHSFITTLVAEFSHHYPSLPSAVCMQDYAEVQPKFQDDELDMGRVLLYSTVGWILTCTDPSSPTHIRA